MTERLQQEIEDQMARLLKMQQQRQEELAGEQQRQLAGDLAQQQQNQMDLLVEGQQRQFDQLTTVEAALVGLTTSQKML